MPKSKKIDPFKNLVLDEYEQEIEDFLENFSAGDILRLKILRAKKEFEINVTLAERK